MRGGPRIAVAAACALLVIGPRRAPAAPDDPRPTGERSAAADPKAEAGERYRKGKGLYEEGAWAAALAEFLASRQLHPTWTATSAAALSLKQLGRYDEALDLFEILLRDFGGELSAERKEAAQRQVVELRGLVGTIEVDGAETGAAVIIDGRGRGEYPVPAPIRVSAGSHVVRVYKEAFEPFEARVEVAGGRTAQVTARLRFLPQSGRLRVVEAAGRRLDVVVDGGVVGQTPWEGPLSPEEHTVLLRGEDRLGTPPMPVRVRFKQLSTLTLTATYLRASLRIEPSPRDARVIVDSVVVGQGAWEGRLGVGDHRVEVRANGYLPLIRQVRLGTGDREVIGAALLRDPDSPRWPKSDRAALELNAAVPLAPTFGGDVAGGCEGACTESPAPGSYGVVRFGYERGDGYSVGTALGVLAAKQTVTGRRAILRPVGLPPSEGLATHTLRLSGLAAGAWGGLTLGEAFPLRLRLGTGALIGSVADDREGTFATAGGASVEPVGEAHSAPFLYLDPEARVGFRLTSRLELNAGVQALVLVCLKRPTWDGGRAIDAASAGIATFPAEALIAPVVLLLAPGLGLRYDL